MLVNKVYLAPMEGVCDPPMRKVLTRYGAYDECFSEFIRVTTDVLPYKTLSRRVPELSKGGRTEAGCLCRVQLLGDEAHPLAGTAQRAVELGAQRIDLNFGCPSRFVHHGGSMLLKEPELVHEIVSVVRESLDPSIFLSVKIRTGFLDHSELPVIMKAVAVDGLNEIIIHARTRKSLYKKEGLNWSVLAGIHELSRGIPLVANGDIVSLQTSNDCYEQTGHIDRQMIGRAAMAKPNLPQIIKGLETLETPLSKILQIAWEFSLELQALNYPEKSRLDRLKQFLGYVHKYDERLTEFFRSFCRAQSASEAWHLLEGKIDELAAAGL